MIVVVVMKLVKGVVRSKRKCSGTVLFVSRVWLMADYSVLLLTSDSLFLLANQLTTRLHVTATCSAEYVGR